MDERFGEDLIRRLLYFSLNFSSNILLKKYVKMAPQKRKAAQTNDDASPVKKRGRPLKNQPTSENNTVAVEGTTSGNGKKRPALPTATSSRSTRVPAKSTTSTDSVVKKKNNKTDSVAKATKVEKVSKKPAAAKAASKTKKKAAANSSERHQSDVSIQIPSESNNLAKAEDEDEHEDADGPSYWLMKAEPESRIEKGKDVKFSIDDLKNASAPEAWDGKQESIEFRVLCADQLIGVRNPTGSLVIPTFDPMLTFIARNNMRTMLKGDLAFFYHSNCKIPGIVGIMEVTQEHSVDGNFLEIEQVLN